MERERKVQTFGSRRPAAAPGDNDRRRKVLNRVFSCDGSGPAACPFVRLWP
jgi:hypothetical protein